MRALIDRDLRQVLPQAVFVLAVATLMGTFDLLYNWRVDHCLGISLFLCLVLAPFVALLAGANALGRESRENLAFLASWPVGLRTIWIVKLLINLGVAAVTVCLSFAICFVLVRMDGYRVGDVSPLLGVPWPLAIAAPWLACFALAFLWSAMVRAPLAAAGGAVATALVFTAGAAYFLAYYLPNRWGPWLGFDLAPFTPRGESLLVRQISMVLAVVALAASAIAFARTPVLEARRRVVRGPGWLVGGTMASAVIAIATFWGVTKPSLSQVDGVVVSPNGRFVVTYSRWRPTGLWFGELAPGAKPHLVSRMPSEYPDMSAGATSRKWGSTSWSFLFNTGKLVREQGYPSAVSPSGRLIAYCTGKDMVVKAADGKTVRSFRSQRVISHPVFSPNEQDIYAWESGGQHQRPIRSFPILMRFDLATGQSKLIAHLPDTEPYLVVSPTGRYAAVRGGHGPGVPQVPFVGVLGLRTGAKRTLDGVYLSAAGWVRKDRYLWTGTVAAKTRQYELRIVDTQTMKVVRSIGPRELEAAAGSALSKKELSQQSYLFAQPPRDGGPVYFESRKLGSKPGDERLLWAAKADGSGLRFVRRDVRQLLGLSAGGDLVFYTRPSATVTLVNPNTGKESVVFSCRPSWH